MLSWDFIVTKVRQIPSSLSPKLPEGHRVLNRQREQLRRPYLQRDFLGHRKCAWGKSFLCTRTWQSGLQE